MAFLTGQRLTADLLNVVYPVLYIKQGTSTRTSTTTLTADSELVNIPLGVGNYSIRFLAFWNSNTVGTNPGFKTQWAFTGTWTNPNRALIGQGVTGTTSPTAATQMNISASATNADASYNQSPNSVFATVREEADNVVVTAAGNLSLIWAQSVSSTVPTVLQPGSTFRVQRIS